MKRSLFAAAALLALASQTLPAFAFNTYQPTVKLIALSPAQVAVISSRPGCTASAGINGTPYFEMPTIAQEMGLSGIAQVKIDLSSSGNLAASQLFSSSGSRWLDAAALQSARMTRFTPETSNCVHVAGSYLYQVEF